MEGQGLAPEDFRLVAGLFSRTGMYVSHCDETGAEQSSADEEKAQMLRALKQVAKVSKVPVIAAAAQEALSLSPPDSETQDTLSSDIRRAVSCLKESGDEAALGGFRKALMYVANSVARAYREELDHHEEEFILETFLNKISGAINSESDPEEFKNINISPAEDSALTLISEALRT